MMNTATAPATTPTPPRLLTLLAHVDATPQDLEPFEMREVDLFEKAHRPDTQVRVEVSRASRSRGMNIAIGLAKIAALPLAMSVAPALGPLGLVAQAAGFMLGMSGASQVVGAIRGSRLSAEPAWNGTRVYDIGADKVDGRLDSPVVSEKKTRKPGVSELGQFIADGMKAYPSQVTAFVAAGHGLAYEECSGYGVDQLKQALDDAARQAGRKVDVVVLDACLMGNLEALHMLKDSAHYAVVSEETLGAAGLPWDEIMPGLPQSQLTAEQFGRQVVEGSTAADGVDTLALVDLHKIGPLSQSVEQLATELRRVIASGGADGVRAALKESAGFPRGIDPISRMSFNVRDLGQLAESLDTLVPDRGVQQAAAKVQAALSDAVVTSTTSPDYDGASHVSIQGTKPFFSAAHYAGQTGLTEWGNMLADLRRAK